MIRIDWLFNVILLPSVDDTDGR